MKLRSQRRPAEHERVGRSDEIIENNQNPLEFHYINPRDPRLFARSRLQNEHYSSEGVFTCQQQPTILFLIEII